MFLCSLGTLGYVRILGISSHPLRFLHTGSDMSFSTEPLRNEHPDLVLGFYHMENVSGNTHNVSGNTHNVSGLVMG